MWQCGVHCCCTLEVYNMFVLIYENVWTGGCCIISDWSLILVFLNYFMDLIDLNLIMS
jgi:hypothetical protein